MKITYSEALSQMQALREQKEALAKEHMSEQAAFEAEEERKAAAAMAPDRDKLITLAATLRGLPDLNMSSPKGLSIEAQVISQIEKFATWLEAKAETLKGK